jgi:hypothetical protein
VTAEDRVLLGAGGVEVLTADGVWPCTVDGLGLARAEVLVR